MNKLAGTIVSALIGACACCAGAYAQGYPSKPLRFVVGFPAGGATDVVARTISQKLGESLGQPVLVDNRGGAASNIGAELVATSPKDGHTIFMGTVSTSINPSLYKKLAYDPLRDFTPVSRVSSTPFLFVVHPSLPARNVKEFIALAKSKPGELNYGSAGSGSGGHLFVEMFGSMARVKLTQVPYKGAAPATTATLSGETLFMFDNIVTTLPLAKAGKLRALAVTTATRSAAAPDMLTIAEAGVPGYDANAWFGVFAPAGTPQPVINRLNTEIVKIVKLPEMRERFLALGAEPVGSTAQEFGAFFRNEVEKWAKVVKTSGAQVD
ncbi:MAG TPA: tripartite tricarboxylate transporter substrate binding protein [Burkholderiales bacterium]|jgi:tripartite-type tricarboxylate transporter receptor subunit TctC|nr:tripartite tricarboxylate transporter substrate binding protein [Burkholderiales bacterium]